MNRVPDPLEVPLLRVDDLVPLLPMSRSSIYESCTRYLESDGEAGIPCIRLSRSIFIPTARLREWLGIDGVSRGGTDATVHELVEGVL